MNTTRFTQGSVTVTLDDGLNRFVRSLLSAAERETVTVLEREATIVRDFAAAEWYQRVDRDTGKSGAIAVVATIDATRGEVRVSVGSTDPRRAGNKPIVAFIRAPGRTSLVLKKVDHKTYWATPAPLRHEYPFVKVHNPKSANGEYLLQALIRTPMRGRIKGIGAELAKAIVARAGR